MIATIAKIGNSQGVRLPKKLLESLGITVGQATEIVPHPEGLLIKPVKNSPRSNWSAKFASVKEQSEIVDFIANDWDKDEWTW